MKIFVKNQFGSEEKAPSEIDNGIRELENHILLQKNNTMEDYYCEIEGELASYIEKIKKDGINFYYQMSKTEKYEFLHMICIQYFRTRALKQRWKNGFHKALEAIDLFSRGIDINKVELDNLVFYYFWHIQSEVAYSLMERNTSMILLTNETIIPFVTSDQPIINLKCKYDDDTIETTELEFYYPISPQKALVINSDRNEIEESISIDEARMYNMQM